MTEQERAPGILVGLSTSSVFPNSCEEAFATARRLGYDGVEVMVWTEKATQDAGTLRGYMSAYGLPVLAIHAPTLLLTQYLWGADPWVKVDRSVQLALDVGAPVVVVHPPFRWQRDYASGFVAGVREREQATGVRIAVENMFPWRSGMEIPAYLPDWDPTDEDYANVCLDFSHAATAGDDIAAMAERAGDRVAHVHLGDGLGSFKDEHLVPGRGSQPCGPVLDGLRARGYTGSVVVEVNTRRGGDTVREADLAESLLFAREHLGQPHDQAARARLEALGAHEKHRKKAGKKARKHAKRKHKRAEKTARATADDAQAKQARRHRKKARLRQAEERRAAKKRSRGGRKRPGPAAG